MKLLILSFFSILVSCSSHNSRSFKTGYADLEMNIPIGLRLCGTFTPRPSTGVHDPLRVYAHVFSQGTKHAAIVGCDLAMISPKVAEKVRLRLKNNPGISKEAIIIHASETHNAPDYFGEFREAFHNEAIKQNNGNDPAESIDFAKILEDSIVETVRKAYKSLEVSSVKYSSGLASGVSFNRRFHMKNGTIGWNPGKGNPNILKPAGPVDPAVPFIVIDQLKSKKRSVLWGFAMHLAILNDSKYAADYPFYVSKHLNAIYSGSGTHFAQVPCCDVIHIDVNNPKPQKSYQWAEVVGKTLAESIFSAIPKSNELKDFDLKSTSKTIHLKTKTYSQTEIEEASKKWLDPDIRNRLNFENKIKNATTMGIGLRYPSRKIPALIQIIQLSQDVAFVGLPGEIAVELGMYIKKKSPYKHTHVIQLSNDWPGYIPTQKIFSGGQYEAHVAKVQSGEGELLANETVKLLHKLNKQK